MELWMPMAVVNSSVSCVRRWRKSADGFVTGRELACLGQRPSFRSCASERQRRPAGARERERLAGGGGAGGAGFWVMRSLRRFFWVGVEAEGGGNGGPGVPRGVLC